MTDLYVVVSAATGEPLWAAVSDQDAAVRIAVNTGNCNLLSGLDLVQHLNRSSINPNPDDVTIRPTTSCGCGYELVWVEGRWEHDAAPYLWGSDHDPDEPAPTGPARDYWDAEDGITEETS